MNDQSARRQPGARASSEVTWPVRSGRLPVLADFFCPRPETGHGLEASFAQPGSGNPAVTVLVGPSGFGKTHLAAAMAGHTARAGAADLQVWVNASSPSAVTACYARAAADIAVADRGVPPEAAAALLLDWLRRTDRPWLVVLDNMTDVTSLRGQWPAGQAGQVLITCHQSADLTELTGAGPRICGIGEFSPREALNYVTGRLYDDADKRVGALDLAADLGYMPLALALATATMSGTALGCRQYRHAFAARRQDLASRMPDGTVSPADVAWSLALDLADQRSGTGLARPVLALAALLDPAGLPAALATSRAGRDYLSGHGRGALLDDSQIHGALTGLAQSGLISIDQAASPALLTVHPAVQETVRRLAPAAVLDAAAQSAADAISEIWPHQDTDPALEHALRCCVCWLGGIAGDLLWLPEPHPVLIRTGTSMTEAGLTRPAVAYWTSMLAASGRTLGPEHAHTLVIRDYLAAACESAGLAGDAVELLARGVAEREQAQGADHPDTLTAKAHLARAYRETGMIDAAIETYERVIADREWVLGLEHPDTLAARSQLGSTLLKAGRAEHAIMVYQRNVADWERALGAEHHEVLTEYLNLGTAYQAADRLDEAIAIFSRVRNINEKMLGSDDPETARAASYLAFATRQAGRLKDAISLYRQALASREAVLGTDHLDTLTTLANLASCYHAAHRMKDAISLYERVLETRERVQGPDHRDTLTTRGNLAGAYHSAGRLSDALPVYEQTLADFERVLGHDDPDTLTSKANLANAYYMARRHTDAITLFERTIADCERALGPDHPLTRTISDNLFTITRLPGPLPGHLAGECRTRRDAHKVNSLRCNWIFIKSLAALASRSPGMIVRSPDWALAGAPSRAGSPMRQGGVRCEHRRLDSHPKSAGPDRGPADARRDGRTTVFQRSARRVRRDRDRGR